MSNLPVHAASHGSVAVFIDWDNFAIGLREEMPDRPPDLGPILRWVRQLGPVAVCRAYGEWRDAAERLAVYSAGVEVVYAPVLPLASAAARPNGGKSLADTEMAVDCVDFLHLIPEIATLVIVSSDKDLIPILRFAQRRGLRVFVVGSDRTAGALRDQSDDYVTYRTLLEQEGEAITTPPVRPMEVPPGRFARAPRLTPARSMLATPTVENTESSTTKADTGPSRATLRRRRGRRRRGGGTGTATPAASAAAPPAAASVEPPAPPEVAESEPDPAMVAPPPAAAETIIPEEPEPPSADAPAAASAADAPSKPEPEPAAAAEESRPALKVLPGESLSRLKGPAPAAEPGSGDARPRRLRRHRPRRARKLRPNRRSLSSSRRPQPTALHRAATGRPPRRTPPPLRPMALPKRRQQKRRRPRPPLAGALRADAPVRAARPARPRPRQ